MKKYVQYVNEKLVPIYGIENLIVVGDKLNHIKFGDGVVTKVFKDNGEILKLEAEFPEHKRYTGQFRVSGDWFKIENDEYEKKTGGLKVGLKKELDNVIFQIEHMDEIIKELDRKLGTIMNERHYYYDKKAELNVDKKRLEVELKKNVIISDIDPYGEEEWE